MVKQSTTILMVNSQQTERVGHWPEIDLRSMLNTSQWLINAPKTSMSERK